MFAKIALWIGRVVREVLIVLGMLVVVVAWQVYGWLKAWGEPVKNLEPVPVVQTIKTPEESPPVTSTADCACASGAECVGPRGGKYCLDPAGRKKYKSQP